MPILDEVHQGIGSGELTTDFDRELLAEAQPYRHVVIHRDGKLKGSFVILNRTPSLDGITLSGLGLGFWLGLPNKDGPVIRRREYIAGNNHLSNGGFELLDAVDFPLFWSISEGSTWVPYTADAHAGTRSMRVSGDLGKDDVLISTDTGDHANIRPGALVRARTWAKCLSAGVRHLRLRTVYEGRSDPPDLLADLDEWTDESEFPGDVAVVGNTVEVGPLTRPQVVPNPGFETGDTYGWYNPGPGSDWDVNNLDPFEGTYALRSNGFAGTTQVLQVDFSPGSPGSISAYPVKVGDRWRFEAAVKIYSGTDGFFDVRVFPNFGAPMSVIGGSASQYDGSGEYTYAQQEAEIQDAGGGLLISLNIWQMTSGDIFFDHITATRIKGNTCRLTAPAVSLTPEKSYRLLAPVTADADCADGAVKFAVLLQGAGRPDQVIESGTVDYQAKARSLLDFSFTPPSGYDSAVVSIVGMDVLAARIVVNEKPTLTCEDTSHYVVDKVIGPTGASWAEYTQDSTAPAGVEKVHVEVIAETGTGDWLVDHLDWHRREATTSIADVVDGLLRDPDTGEYLVSPGNILTSGVPAWDWYIDLLNNGEAMREFLTGGRCDPPLEWRHDPNNTFHVGLAADIFADSGLLFVDQDLLLLSRSEVQTNVQDQLSRVLTIGAAIQRRAPLPDAVIVGEAEATIPGAYDWFGNPVRRTRVIEDSTLNFQAFADARAADALEASALQTQSVNVEIAAWHAWGDFVCGDWLHAYKEEALLEDLDNPKTYKGRRVYPKMLRALSRRLDMARGDGWEVGIRRPDASIYWIDPDLIRWAERTKATVELGERRIDYANDPQGPAAGLQFLRHRALLANS